jgi:hypothetical protein
MKLRAELHEDEFPNSFNVAEAVYILCKGLRIDEKAVAQMILIQVKSEGADNEQRKES